MRYYYDQRYRCCDTCHYFRDSRIGGRKACGRYAMAFSESGEVVDGICEEHRTEAQWQEEQRREEMMRKRRSRK